MSDSSPPSDTSNGFCEAMAEHNNYRMIGCSEEGLRSLSQKLSNMNVTTVGRCLGLAERVIQTTEEDRIYDGTLKMFHLLVEWRDGQEQANWGMLADCLQDLSDDSLMEDLRQIASEGLGVLPIEAESRDIGKPGWSMDDLTTEAKPNKQLREDLEKLQDEFSGILILAQTSFMSRQVPLDQVRLWVTKLCVDQQENIPAFDKSELKEINTSSINEIFTFLTRHEVWDILNFRVLQRMVKQFIPDDRNVKESIEKYAAKVEKFKNAIILRDYIRVRVNGPKQSPEYITVLAKIETNRSYNNFTLADVDEEEKFLANQFLLHQFIFRLKESRRGCVQLIWLVPSSVMSLLKPEQLAKSRKALQERKILEIRVDNRYVYMVQNPDPIPAPRHLFPSTSTEDYDSMYQQSITDPDKFWSVQAEKFLEWDQKFTKVNDCKKEEGIVRWFTGGKLNVSKNCLDRHVAKYPDRTAIIWERNDQTHEKISYRELLEQTCQVANVLKNQCGVEKGDIVVIYMPTMPLAVASMLACARIGAVHSVVFAMFTPEKLKERISIIGGVKVLVTADQALIGGQILSLKENVDKALEGTSVQHVLVAKRTGAPVAMKEGRDISLEKAMEKELVECEPVPMDSEDDLFIVYTSGTTGPPTGVVHTQAGYLLMIAVAHKYVFNYEEGDVFACVADLGWILGHNYVVYGPLCNGGTTVLFEGTATYPNEGRYWKMVQQLKVNQFHTTPSAIRRLMKSGDKYVNMYDLSSLKTIGSVGELLSTAVWKWYFEVVGKKKCILVDTWGQTEAGGICISPQPGPPDGSLKPGYPMRPFFGVEPVLTNEKGDELEGNGVQGLFCLRNPTPGMCRRIISNSKSLDAYFNNFEKHSGLYFTQDYAYRDVDGHYQIQGRKDDIVRIKGVWVQVPEIESAIVKSDDRIEEATIVPLCDPKEQKESSEDTYVTYAEDTAVVVQVNQQIKEEELADIAKNVWERVVYKGGLKAVLQRIFVTQGTLMSDSGKISRTAIKKEILKHGEDLPEEWSVSTNILIFQRQLSQA